MDRGVWWATVHGFAKSQTWLSDRAGAHIGILGIVHMNVWIWASLVAQAVRNLPETKETTSCQCRRHGFNPWIGTIPWRRKW